MLTPPTIARLMLMVTAPLIVILVAIFRKPQPPGAVQRFPKFLSVVLYICAGVMLLFGVTGLVGAREVAGGLFGMGLGLLFLAFAYYYSRYFIVVKPDSITVNQPFRGQMVITHKNIVSVKEWDYRQKWYKVKFRDLPVATIEELKSYVEVLARS